MPEQIVEDNWPLGWIPSYSQQADFGATSQGLLRMDNLTLDEKGSLKLINRPTPQSAILGYKTNSIYGALVNSRKLRYLYDENGVLHRNYGAAVSQSVYDLTLGSGGSTLKAGFGNALGHIIACAGNIRIKDRGDIQWPLNIPKPAAVTLVNGIASNIDLANLDGGGNYTNWNNVETSAYNDAGTKVTFTPNTGTQRAIIDTIYGTAVDTTNFGTGTGFDTPNDNLTFTFECADPSQLNYIGVECLGTGSSGGIVTDEFFATIEYSSFINGAPNPAFPDIQAITIVPSVSLVITIPRKAFLAVGAPNWNAIKAFRLTIGTFTTTTFEFSKPLFANGAVTGEQDYICVELNDTGQFLQFSISSDVAALTAAVSQVTMKRNSACNAQCNNFRVFRNNTALGQYIEVYRETGAYGFTPLAGATGVLDTLSDNDALAAAAIDNSKVLQFYRTQIPATVIGMIAFAGREVYLTANSFFPSFQLDFGSYDSRFNYELVGTNTERCLFITKLSVGTFIVATTVDFYQCSGDFSLISTTNPDGTTTVTQNINIQPLGISDPAINSSFTEVEGNIFYMSARGLRSMSNGVSTLLNTSTDLLFRGETRYGYPPVALLPNDTSLIGIVASGTRIYLALPFANGNNAIMVSTYNPPSPADLRGTNYWRPMTMAALCLFKEQDGTVIYGDQTGFIGSLEDLFSGGLSLNFLTQFNYGQHPTQTKEVGSIELYVNTGGLDLTYTVSGLLEDGTIVTFTTTINSNGLTVLKIDPHIALTKCIAYESNIYGTTTAFELGYIILIVVEEYPPLTFYAIQPFSNLGTDEGKQIDHWGVLVDSLGQDIVIKVSIDGRAPIYQTIGAHSEGISSYYWINYDHIIGLDWQIEVISAVGMHFFKFLEPVLAAKYPAVTYYAIFPFSNLGKDTLKKLSKWGFVADTLGRSVVARVVADNQVIETDVATSPSPQGITTFFWFNLRDIAALDWQLEVISQYGMRFFKFMNPDVLQVYPPGRLIDQIGPLDLDREGIAFQFRLRLINSGSNLHYKVFDNDVLATEDDIATTVNVDSTYEVILPKGINTSVLRITLQSDTIFYRFSLEVKVRSTGKETEQRWVKV